MQVAQKQQLEIMVREMLAEHMPNRPKHVMALDLPGIAARR
ncbi:MAG TPA: hypothetical protein VFS86_11340 [Rhodanobacteraceae bacterium]|nr:hypothetical protein [Rhodanobacteraceae bacterium]